MLQGFPQKRHMSSFSHSTKLLIIRKYKMKHSVFVQKLILIKLKQQIQFQLPTTQELVGSKNL